MAEVLPVNPPQLRGERPLARMSLQKTCGASKEN